VRRLNVLIVGGGQVGETIVEALHADHSVTVVDQDAERARSLGSQYDVLTLQGNGASRRILTEAGAADADLIITCTTRDEVNIVAALFCKKMSGATTVVRVANAEYIDVWRSGDFDFDLIVSPPVETANAITRLIGVPAARQTDVFADGRVQMVEFDIQEDHPEDEIVGKQLAEARLPPDSKVVSIIRGNRVLIPRGRDVIQPGDRIVVIGSPAAARAWSDEVEHNPRIDSVVVLGTRKTSVAVASQLTGSGVHVRLIEHDLDRARWIAEMLPEVRVLHGDATDVDFLTREHLERADAVICGLGTDPENLMAGTHARAMGVPFIIGIVNHPRVLHVFEQAGIDVALNPQVVTAEEILRFTRDPRTQAVAILEGGGAEVLEIEVRPESKLIGVPFRDLPETESFVGAIVRNGAVIFPHGDDHLEGGDSVVMFTRAGRADQIEQAL
jgi:trk system potassium uptake protein TrkA